jgi:hypothetical protein
LEDIRPAAAFCWPNFRHAVFGLDFYSQEEGFEFGYPGVNPGSLFF